MIIPIKCFTCGNVLEDKYRYYQEQVLKMKTEDSNATGNIKYLTKNNAKKTPEGEVLDKMLILNMCCRRHMLTHVDIE